MSNPDKPSPDLSIKAARSAEELFNAWDELEIKGREEMKNPGADSLIKNGSMTFIIARDLELARPALHRSHPALGSVGISWIGALKQEVAVNHVLDHTFPNIEQPIPYIGSMYVHERKRGHGIGTMLMHSVHRRIAEKQDAIPMAALRVRDAETPAIKLYESLGYEYAVGPEQTLTVDAYEFIDDQWQIIQAPSRVMFKDLSDLRRSSE